MKEIISFHRYVAGTGMKHITFYYEPDAIKSQGGPAVRVVLSGQDNALLAETTLDTEDAVQLGGWLRKVTK